MCDMGLGIGLSAAGSLMGAAGSIASGNASNKAARYQAQLQEQNAEVAQQNAKLVIERGQRAAHQRGIQGGQEIGAQKVAFAANGVETTSGSALDIMADTAMYTDLDSRLLLHQAGLEAQGFHQQVNDMRAQATLTRAQGRAAKSAGLFNGIGTLIGGVGSAATQFAGAKHDGLFGKAKTSAPIG